MTFHGLLIALLGLAALGLLVGWIAALVFGPRGAKQILVCGPMTVMLSLTGLFVGAKPGMFLGAAVAVMIIFVWGRVQERK